MSEERPTCATCGRVLRRHANRLQVWVAGNPEPDLGPDAVVTKRQTPVLHEPGGVLYWLPEDGTGYRGEGLFCSLRCGYRWATRTLEAIKKLDA